MGQRKPEPDLVTWVTAEDVGTVLRRIHEDRRSRLRDVFMRTPGHFLRGLGYVTRRGRRDINLCSRLPYRVSLGRALARGQNAREFGAPARGQWPPWAVRRFLLYDVLLHELGHLQIVDPKSTDRDRKYAAETLAQEFADTWRRKLWAVPYDHWDPIHDPPAEEESR